MRCPYCRHPDSRVVDSREAEDGQLIRRRRSCPECGRRFTTVEEAVLAVVKRSGVTEPFSRAKIIVGVRKACQGRPVDDDALALLAQHVEDAIRARGAAEVPSHDVGLAILGPLRDLDEVAYLRFASVYRSFDSLTDFEQEIAALRAERPAPPADGGQPAGAAGTAQSRGPSGAPARDQVGAAAPRSATTVSARDQAGATAPRGPAATTRDQATAAAPRGPAATTRDQATAAAPRGPAAATPRDHVGATAPRGPGGSSGTAVHHAGTPPRGQSGAARDQAGTAAR